MSNLLTIPEAAERLKVSVPTVRRWIRSGRIHSQLTLGPYGEQWMVDPDSVDSSAPTSTGNARTSGVYVPVQELEQQSSEHPLLKEAEQALEQAMREKDELEQEVRRARAELSRQVSSPAPAADGLLALRCDLEGSERERLRLQRELQVAEREREQAYQELRGALQALHQTQERLQQQERELQHLRAESFCVRRLLATRLGVDEEEADLLSLFFQWEAAQTLRRPRSVQWTRLRTERGSEPWSEAE